MEKQEMERLSEETAREIEERRAAAGRGTRPEFKYLRRRENADAASAFRPAFVRDVEKIINSAYYNRLSDKTQVLSFYRNDDITRRALHVQLVSRIARTVGDALGLDLDLIEAIALGHDIGHTPFGHAGEAILSRLLRKHNGTFFHHNVQSVRVLDTVFRYNLTLETLDGILCHNGELPAERYAPAGIKDFAEFDERIDRCLNEADYITKLVPATKEGCLVRLCDIIAYLGKDRQDYARGGLGKTEDFPENPLGRNNAVIINNLCVNLIENSLGKDYVMLDETHFEGLKAAKADNYRVIYKTEKVTGQYSQSIEPMMERVYERLLKDCESGDENSIIYRHHIKFVREKLSHLDGGAAYLQTPPPVIVADYISGMTDDYFLELYENLFGIRFKGYFDD